MPTTASTEAAMTTATPHAYRRIPRRGDSAGGNLVLVTLLRLRELGLPLPAGCAVYHASRPIAGNCSTSVSTESPASDSTGASLRTTP